MKNNLIKAIISFIILSIIVIAVSSYFVFNKKLIGPIFLILGLLSLILLRFLNIKIKSVYPDIIFGLIDNGVLIFAAVLGGIYAGVIGAIIGGAVGNTITDGLGGLFEGHIAQNQRKYKIDNLRTALSTMLGKMTGCLFGAGIGLVLVWLISLI
jgi:hypothetical protein|tara:strand:- start:3320 stop:3781 length:462 start_codon:yes stop_codon:yes gene_type:complete